MTITTPKSYEYHGDLPDGTMLFSSKKYSVAITISAHEQIVSIKRRDISRTKEVDAVAELIKFGIRKFERFSPWHRHNAIYFRILSQPQGEPGRHNE